MYLYSNYVFENIVIKILLYEDFYFMKCGLFKSR